MATPLLTIRRHGWLVVVVVVALAMAVAALVSPDRQRRLVDAEAEGPMHAIAGEAVQRVRVDGPNGEREWRRGDPRWSASAPALDTAIRLLRHSVPERRFEASLPEFALDPPALRVLVFTGDGTTPDFEAAFGATNPIGLARYARIREAGGSAVVLLPAYVAEAWEALERAP